VNSSRHLSNPCIAGAAAHERGLDGPKKQAGAGLFVCFFLLGIPL
jgi:hypothetical protein